MRGNEMMTYGYVRTFHFSWKFGHACMLKRGQTIYHIRRPPTMTLKAILLTSVALIPARSSLRNPAHATPRPHKMHVRHSALVLAALAITARALPAEQHKRHYLPAHAGGVIGGCHPEDDSLPQELICFSRTFECTTDPSTGARKFYRCEFSAACPFSSSLVLIAWERRRC